MDAAGLSIGLAGIVLKLVIFSLDFVGDAKQVYKHGATDRNVDLSTVTKSVEDATTSLVKHLDSFSDKRVLDTDDEQLKELSQRAAEIGRELAQRLRRVTADDMSKWKSFKVAALGMWDAGEIEKTEKRLNAIKDQVQLRILVSIREKVDQSHDIDNSRILSTLEEVAKQQAGSKEDTKHMIEKLNNADEIGRSRHEELVQLGTQLLKGINAISISRSSVTGPFPQAPASVHDETARKEAEKSILKSLWYPSMHSRQETISETYADTFQWVFEDPKTTGKSWDSFVDFLKGNTSTYWITGKPGCGKSTLMKFISDSPKTQALLEQWAGKRELIRASYYFYYSGGENQKSEIGLIRSLLYSILDRRRDLIPTAFESRYQDTIEGRKRDNLSLPEAKRVLKNLIQHNPNLYLFISIDGLDEFDPAVSRTRVQCLIDLTRSLEELRNVKVLVSSRPLPEFELGYDGCPSLSVHHLTQEDIRRYAYEKLVNHPRMKALARKDPESTSGLLQSIVEHSLGVFLWVRVVTESLVEGLTNYDSIDDLKKRVDDLPSDLQELYRTMLSRIDDKYRPQTARLLCFIYHMHRGPGEPSIMDLWFAEYADDNMVRNTPVKPMEYEEVQDRVQELEILLKSRCLGLVETMPTQVGGLRTHNVYFSIYAFSTKVRRAVGFLHRSVYEFLGRHDVWAEFVQKHLSPTFSVTLSLFRSAILIIKTCRLPLRHSHTCELIMGLATNAGQRAKSAELETKQSHADLVHELDIAMNGVMPLVYCLPQKWKDFGSIEACALNSNCHWSTWCRNMEFSAMYNPDERWWPMCDKAHGSLMAFAAHYGLKHYIESQVASEGRKLLAKPGLPLLGHALIPLKKRNVETVKYLLDEGCDINELYCGISVWEWFLWMVEPFPRSGINFHTVSIVEAALLAGASPNVRMLYPMRAEGAATITTRDFSSWGLSWHPNSISRGSVSVCTILLALTREHQWLKDHVSDKYGGDAERWRQDDETLRRVIRYLEERGAVKKEWTDGDSVRRIFVNICQTIDKKSAYEGRRERWYKKLRRRLKCYTRRWK
ncbi:hypothetical protein F5B21DRAFT_493864 [Xylaria acuta]|nr:hypothetical protein F5B21DRAFT_493864 [Xylaria acuta]